MVDLKEWQGPILGGLVTLVLGLFGVQTYKRKQSSDDLADVQNTVAGVHLGNLLAENERLKKEVVEAMQSAQVNYQLFVAEQHRANVNDIEIRRVELEAKAKIDRLMEQVTKLTQTMVKYRPQEKDNLSGFGDLEKPQ